MPDISVLIADGQQLVRNNLRQLIESQDDMVVVGEARCGSEALVKVHALHPQILILDVATPRRKSFNALDLISAAATDSRVIVTSLHRDEIYVQEVFKAGAMSYLIKTDPAEKMLRAIRLTAQCERRGFCAWPEPQILKNRRLMTGTPGKNSGQTRQAF